MYTGGDESRGAVDKFSLANDERDRVNLCAWVSDQVYGGSVLRQNTQTKGPQVTNQDDKNHLLRIPSCLTPKYNKRKQRGEYTACSMEYNYTTAI